MIYSTFPNLTSAITGARSCTTDGKKTLQHLRFDASKKRRGSRAGSVELQCANNTFESSAQTAERKALQLYALWFLAYSTFQRCYCVKEVYLQALWWCVQVPRPVTLVKEADSTLVCQ